MYNNKNDLHLITNEESIIYLNNYLRDVLGLYEKEEEQDFIKRNFDLFIQSKWLSETHFVLNTPSKLNIHVKYQQDLYFWYFLDFNENKTFEFYQTLIEDNENVFLLFDQETRKIEYANKAACAFYQYNLNEFTQLTINQINVCSQEQINQEKALAKQEMRECCYFKHRLRNKEIRHVEVKCSPIRVNNRQMMFTVVCDANTKTDQTRFIQNLFLHSPLAESILDVEGRFIAINTSFTKYFDFTLEEVYNKKISDVLVPPELLYEYEKIYHDVSSGEIVRKRTVRYTKHKKLVNVELIVLPCQMEDQFVGLQVIYNDISKELIKEKEQKFILENTHDLIAKIGLDGTVLYANHAFCKLFGRTKEQLIGSNSIQLNNEFNLIDSNWLFDATKPPYTSRSISRFPNGNHISWRNDAVLNENGAVEYIISVGHDITEIKKLNEQLKLENITDPLTGLLNQRGLLDKIETLHQVYKLTAFFIYVNNYRSINDYYGHKTGEQLIKHFALDLAKLDEVGCIVCKKSSHEFILILPEQDNLDQFNTVKSFITDLLKKNYTINNFSISVSANIGYAVYPNDTHDRSKLISLADLAMLESKKHAYKFFNRYNKTLSDELERKMILGNKLRYAIEQDKLEIYFQPIFETKSKKVMYTEALARWIDEEDGYIPPNEFITLAEDLGLIISLDYFLIKKAIHKYRQLKQLTPFKNSKLTLNVSPQTLLHDQLCQTLSEIIAQANLNSNEICIEISENTFINNLQLCVKQIQNIKKVGIQVALDDFGREYSSLSILDSMDFDIIKVDKLFVEKIDSVKNLEIIKMILTISKLANKIMIVEGVETEQQSNLLKALGCDLQQGFYFAKPEKHI